MKLNEIKIIYKKFMKKAKKTVSISTYIVS